LPSSIRRRSSRVGATEHQDLHELLEDHVIGYARPVTAEWMVRLSLG
jgi:hypothetical protein